MPRSIQRTLVTLIVLATATAALAAKHPTPVNATVYVDAKDDFSGYIVAALLKKQVPVTMVTDRQHADYTLQSTNVLNHSVSTGSVIARCLLASCYGIEDTSTVSVELIRTQSTAIDWSYTVHKQRGANYNQQSMAEAIAKHLKDYFHHHNR